MIRVVLPAHLRTLSRVEDDLTLEVAPPVTLGAVLDALEARYPMLRGAVRDGKTGARRPFIRFFMCGHDCSLDPPEKVLPEAVASGVEPLYIVGAIAGGALGGQRKDVWSCRRGDTCGGRAHGRIRRAHP